MSGIRESLKDAVVLLTGGTGFMGKVLIEKLLRTTEVKRIHVVIRPKRGLGSRTRLLEMFKLPVFDLVRKMDPELFGKVEALEGDLGQENLGLEPSKVSELAGSVTVVYNFAASLKLEDTLKQLIVHNTVSALRLLEMATGFNKLKAFIHLSTAFCHCELEVLEEKLYEPPVNPYDVITALEWMDDDIAVTITPKLLGDHPNCYTYTKRLAEGLVKDFGKKLPLTVVRPSIVTPAMKEPLPGWVDSLNGPMGILVAGAKGVLRSMLCNPEYRAEVIPVDIAINAIFRATWERINHPIGNGDIMVYNTSSGEVDPVTYGDVLELGKSVLKDYPLDCGLWYPGGTIRTNPFNHAMVVLFAQTIPAYFIDFIFYLLRQKRFMVRVQNRIKLGMVLLQYFTMKQWNFSSTKFRTLGEEGLSTEEKEMFFTANVSYEIKEYMKNAILGARVYCMKEPLENLPRARKQMIMMFWIEKIAQLAIMSFIGWFFYNNIAFIKNFVDTITLSTKLIN